MNTTKQKKLFEASNGGPSAKTSFSDIIAIGTVVDTNDPMQWGRIRVLVSVWGDSWEHEVEGMPWAMYVSPFGGQTSVGTRGPGIDQTEGGVAYGMWAIPKMGAQVVVMSLDEDHTQRLYLGCVFDMGAGNTLPHGRWISEDHPAIDNAPNKGNTKPYGPFSAGDKLIQPLANNLNKAFGNGSDAFEWSTRAADYAASRVDVSQLHNTTSNVQDDSGVQVGDWVSTQGYQQSRLDPNGTSSFTNKNYDSQIVSITSPGFHSVAMDDRMENCRMRFRTSAGHQIILDDTNERIYIATAQGNNWIELDQAGNIDMFTTNKVNIRAAQEINLTSDKTIRMYAKEGIHMRSDKEIRLNSKEDTSVHSDKMVKLESGDNFNIISKADTKITTKGNTHIKSGGTIFVTGEKIHLNGPTAADADEPQIALYTNRIPAHEPWGRMMTKNDEGVQGELSYSDKRVGKHERGKDIQRGVYWRR